MTVLNYCDDSSKQHGNTYNLGGILISCSCKIVKYSTNPQGHELPKVLFIYVVQYKVLYVYHGHILALFIISKYLFNTSSCKKKRSLVDFNEAY